MSILFWIPSKRTVIGLTAIVLIAGCASGGLKHKRVSLTSDPRLSGEGSFYNTDYSKTVFDKYCLNGKQIREMKLNLKYIAPKAPQGIPVDDAGQVLKEFLSYKSCYVQGAFWFTSHIRSCDAEWGSDLYDYEPQKNCFSSDNAELGRSTPDSEADVIAYGKHLRIDGAVHQDSGKFEACDPELSCAMQPVFIMPDQSKKFLLLFDPREGNYWRSSDSRAHNYVDVGVRKLFLSELNILRDNYTMLLPTEFQDKFFGENGKNVSAILNDRCKWVFPQAVHVNLKNDHEQLIQTYLFKKQYLGYENGDQVCNTPGGLCEDVGGPISLGLSADEREALWLRYILTFTSVKEAVESDPQLVDYEVSLNLEPFCKYARPMSDLISR